MANKANGGELTAQERDIFDYMKVWGGNAAIAEFPIGQCKANTIWKKGGGDGPLPLVDRRVMLEDDDRACFSLTEIVFKGYSYLQRQNAKLSEQVTVLHSELHKERELNKQLRRLARQGEHRLMTQLIKRAKDISREDGNGNGEPTKSDITRFRENAGMA